MVDKGRLALMQVSVLVVAAILAFGGSQKWLLFIIYFAFFFGLNMLLMRRSGGGSAREVLEGKVLFKEENATEHLMRDEGFAEEMAQHARTMMRSFLALIVVLIIFWGAMAVYKPATEAIASILGAHGWLAPFIFWLIVLEATFAINIAIAGSVMFGATPQGIPQMPRRYIVTDRGIVVPGFTGLAVKFPLGDDAEVHLNEARGFVEIRTSKFKLRLYTSNPRRLYEIINRFGRPGRRSEANTRSSGSTSG